MQGISDVQQNCVSKTSHYRAPSQGRNVRTEPHQTMSKQAYRGFQTCNKNSMPCHALPCIQAFTSIPNQPQIKQGQTTRSKNGRGYPTCNKPPIRAKRGPQRLFRTRISKGWPFIVCACRYTRDGETKTKTKAPCQVIIFAMCRAGMRSIIGRRYCAMRGTASCFWVSVARQGCGEEILWECFLDGNRLVQVGMSRLGDDTEVLQNANMGAVMCC